MADRLHTTDVPDFVEPFLMDGTHDLVCCQSRPPTDEEMASLNPSSPYDVCEHQTWYTADLSRPGWHGDGDYILVDNSGGCCGLDIRRTEGGGLRIAEDLLIPSDEVGALMAGCEDEVIIYPASVEKRLTIFP